MTEEILTPTSLGGLPVYKASDIVRPVRAMLYARPGAGKTPLVASADNVAAFSPLLVIDCDDGPKSLRSAFPSVHVVSPRTLEQLQRVCDALPTKAKCFKSICVDGVTTVQYRGYEHLHGNRGVYNSFTNFESPGWQNHGYQASASQMAILADTFMALKDHHIFFTAWAKNVATPTKANPDPPAQWEPAFTPAASSAILGRFDSILYLGRQEQNGNSVPYIRSRGNARIMARDRDDLLPETIVNPTMQLLAKHWGLDHSIVKR